MVKFRLYFWLFLFVVLQTFYGEATLKDYTLMFGEAKKAAQEEITRTFGFRATGTGGGAMTVVRGVNLFLDSDEPLTLEEGRRAIIACSNILLKHINGYRQLRPFLVEYPFPIERINLSIFISQATKPKVPQGQPTVFSVSHGMVEFERSPDKPAPLIKVHQESYAEALQIVAKEDKSLNVEKKTNSGEKVKAISSATTLTTRSDAASTLPKYIGPEEEQDAFWYLDDYGTAIAKKYDMVFHRAGDFSDDKSHLTYALYFIDFHAKTLDEGKQFAIGLVRDFLRELRSNPEIKRYHEDNNNDYKKMRYPPLITDEPVPEQMGLKITFWDKNFDRPKKPALAEIDFLNGVFYYYVANPETQARELVLKEPFTEESSSS